MKILFDKFPREVATPYRFYCESWDKFLEFVNLHNGKNSVYTSVYNCDEHRRYDKSIIDKIFFDFDGESAYQNMYKLHWYLLNKQLKHIVIFSGGGYHLYIFIRPQVFNDNKASLAQIHKYFINQLNLEVDQHIVGDIARITRVCNTWNSKRGRYCIPLSNEDIEKGHEYILEHALKQHWEFNIYGRIEFDASEFNNVRIEVLHLDIPEFTGELSKDEVLKELPPCTQHWLENKEINGKESGNWQARYYFALIMRDLGYPKSVVDKLAKEYFGRVQRKDEIRNNYEHFKRTKASTYAYDNRTEFAPNCDTLFTQGLCPGKCAMYPLHKRLYA